MNTETLHAIAQAVRSDLRSTELRERLTELEAAITNAINAPTDPGASNSVVAAREALVEAVGSSEIPNFPPLWLEYLEEMGVIDLSGETILQSIDAAFRENQVTLPAVQAVVASLHQRLDQISGAFDQVAAGFEFFDIGTEELEPGAAEIAFLIPRGAVANELGRLGREFQALRRIIGPFQEIATGSRHDVEIRTVSSSNFGLLLDLDPETARLIAQSVSYLIDRYKQILEIRKLREEISRLAMPSEIGEQVEAFAAEQMGDAIREVTDRVMQQYSDTLPSDGREHEIRSDLTYALENTAHRIDIGYSIQVRSRAPELAPAAAVEDEEGEGGASNPENERVTRLHDEIWDEQINLRFLRMEGEPILGELGVGPDNEVVADNGDD